ncbi:MAG TPA: DinB family protein [Rhodothermales bacterium]|nr:DinB family protein [Rhodothermales bacterium]
MIPLEFLRDLFRHMEWADSSVWRAVAAPDQELVDEYLHNTLHHLHATQRAFMDFWSGKPAMPPDASQFATLENIREWARPFYDEADVLLTSLEDTDLTREAVVPWVRYIERMLERDANPTLLGETLFQVAAHSTYHRGQVNRRLRELGAEPPLLDYIVWVWRGRPQPDWNPATSG